MRTGMFLQQKARGEPTGREGRVRPRPRGAGPGPARGGPSRPPWRGTPAYPCQLHARGASASRPRRFSFTPVAHPKPLNRACLGRARACRLSNPKAPLASLTPKAAPVAYPKPRNRGPKQRRPAAALPVCCPKQRRARRHATRRAAPQPARKRIVRGLAQGSAAAAGFPGSPARGGYAGYLYR